MKRPSIEQNILLLQTDYKTTGKMKKVFILISIVFANIMVFGQGKKTATEDYILQYRNIAIENEKQYGVPASITLAQGIIESGSGRSSLAKESNNHFGIKCHSSWTGEKTYKDDDNKNDCFRVYDNAEESFTDHSLFLTKNKRYASLFELDKTDYKSWAEGLKQCGYATNPNYANILIDIIELYELDNINDNSFYLIADNTFVEQPSKNKNIKTEDKNIPENKTSQPAQTKKKKSIMERLFGNTEWWKRKHESEQERKRREMDEKIQKMIDEQDVKRNDFEINFE